MKRITSLLAFATAILFSGNAWSADDTSNYAEQRIASASGFYFSVHGGAMQLSDATSAIPSDGDESHTEYDLGSRFGGALGYEFNEYLAAEVELSFARAAPSSLALYNVDPLSTGIGTCGPVPQAVNPCFQWKVPAGGAAEVLTLMGNIIASTNWNGIKPYVGVGGGLAHIHSRTTFDYGAANNLGFSLPVTFDDTDATWAAQVIVGADVPLNDVVSIGGRYRAQWIGPFTVNDGVKINVERSFWQSAEVVLKVKVN
ncbi:MAG: outer membrane beta-barrel protein [Hyphomicrobiales bacterium]|nr:outer membrane beta-barrel protein [Hyphomicrobiales bacterium]